MSSPIVFKWVYDFLAAHFEGTIILISRNAEVS